jgi:glyoxylase-like metal-dependent hydrolase (beta-lactamase superfamily II)
MNERFRQVAGIRSLRLGEVKVSYVPDGAVQLIPTAWLPDTTGETWAAHPEYLDDTGNLVASVGALLVEHGDRAMLIDAGLGPQSLAAEPGNPYGAAHGGALLDNLATLGRRPEDIEAVAITHLHLDHVGWAWLPAPGTDRPAFTGADYLLTEPEWAHRHLIDVPEAPAAMASKVRTVADGEEIFPGVRVQHTLGHTAGHAAYVITGGDRRLIAFGDAMHSPIQVSHPEWSAVVDHDTGQSEPARRQLVADLAQPGTIGFGIHFADVQFGHVADGGWLPIDS